MSLVKKLIAVFIVLLLGGIVLFIFREPILTRTHAALTYSTCDTPKYYSLGRIDKEFHLTEAEFQADIQEAQAIWNKASGKQLFVFKDRAPLQVHLIYDKRQSLNEEITSLNNDVVRKDTDLKPQIDDYNRKSADLQKRIQALNTEIMTVNDRGGATREEYDALIARQESLQKEARDLNAIADSLSISRDNLNQEIDDLDETVSAFNDALQIKSEGGKYSLDDKGERIEINIYSNKAELIHVLAHEIGHAIGMDHVKDEKSIMFERTNEIITPSNDDLAALAYACRTRSRLTEGFQRWQAGMQVIWYRVTHAVEFSSSS